ncbi:MAG: ATP-binding protein [Candidatus Omnitrophota bacterium]|nr:tRNA 2-thiocytidine(32) synthetase TtcA [Candidatus Omnitrophota bacterium]
MISIQESFETAIADYRLIEHGDRILVAVSGGKDSLTLLSLLSRLRKDSAYNFSLVVLHVRTDFHCASCTHTDTLIEIFKKLEVEYLFKDVKVLDSSGMTNCFWCSWNKRKTFFKTARELSCNKIALGHHKNDIVETILMNMFFNGMLSAMRPQQELFGGAITLIRPLCYVEEGVTAQFARGSGFPSKLCKCPFGRDSQRRRMKEIIGKIQHIDPAADVKENIFKGFIGLRGACGVADSTPEAR